MYEEIIKKYVDRYLSIGEKKMKDGSMLIGKAPHIGTEAWLHELFAPLTINDIGVIEDQLGKPIPKEFKEFLLTSFNGIRIFVSTFSLYGMRKELGRSIDGSVQPFSILTPNTVEKPKNALESYFFIGGYGKDSSKLYIDTSTNKIHYCKKNDATSLCEWASLQNMLEEEFGRIFSLFDESGMKRNDTVTTIPF